MTNNIESKKKESENIIKKTIELRNELLKKEFEYNMTLLQSESAYYAAQTSLDATMRTKYASLVTKMAKELREKANKGEITWMQASQEAQKARNAIMEYIRKRSSPVGRAEAQKLKPDGSTFDELLKLKTTKLYGQSEFQLLNQNQKNQVYKEIVDSSARPNKDVTAKTQSLSKMGRALILLSACISAYNIAVAEDKVSAVKREAAVTGSGVLGGMVGGAMFGLMCGPAAPVCVSIGAFTFGALAAFGVDYAFFE